MDDTISRQAALDCVTYDVEYTTERIKALPSLQPTCNQLATDCISRQDALNIRFSDTIKEDGVLYVPLWDFIDGLKSLPSAQPEVPDINVGDIISRQAAIDLLRKRLIETANNNVGFTCDAGKVFEDASERIRYWIDELPSAQPEITDEQAIGHLQASGWMQSHDKQMYEMGLKEGLADDSDSYDALLPSSQPETNCSEFPNTSDVVSRKAVREMVATWSYDMAEWEDVELALSDVDKLPSVHPEVIHCKDCDLWHRVGCPMNVFVEKSEPGYFCGTGRRKENE